MSMPKSLVSIHDFSKEELLYIVDLAAAFEKECKPVLQEKVVATIFFEPSTRTRLSFETAANRLGARVVGFSDADNTSVSKGETLKDTIMMVSNYVDLIVMRHPKEGSARYASEVSRVPVINAGDGANQHPTQTLLDMYSIKKTQGRLDNLTITMAGDLKYGRTVHSLLQAMSQFNTRFKFIAPPELRMPDEYKQYLTEQGLSFTEHTDLAENIDDADILYMTRVQRERFSDLIEYERVKNVYVLKNSLLKDTKPNMRILHPLPRVNEISTDVDNNPKAYYFEQARNGIFTRMAIIHYLLNGKTTL
jgi:aspartate carbamoyltransferase catalytic subunit